MPGRLLTAALAAITAVLGMTTAAHADTTPTPDPGGSGGGPANGMDQGTASAGVGGSTVTVTAGAPGSGATSPGTSGQITACTSQIIDATAAAELAGADPSVSVTLQGPPGGGGTWLLIECPGGSPSLIYTGPGTPPAAPNPQVLAQTALASMHLAAMPMRTAPSAATVIAPFTTWFAVDPAAWKPMTATASAKGVSATATARPDHVIWSVDGHPVTTCAGPGAVYDPGEPYDAQHTDCSYAFPRSSAGEPGLHFQVSATVVWSVSWSSTGAGGVGGSLGQVSGDQATAPLEVDEVQVVNP